MSKRGHGSTSENVEPALLNSCSEAPTRVNVVSLQTGAGVGVGTESSEHGVDCGNEHSPVDLRQWPYE
jgi:hypothetical protein